MGAICVIFFSLYFEMLSKLLLKINRVSEPACFRAAPGIFYPELAAAPGKREYDFRIFEN